jgi:hypothetical protein
VSPRVELYIDYLPPRRWVRRLVDRLLSRWFVPHAEHQKLKEAFDRADRFRTNWMQALFHSQGKGMPRDERESFFRNRHCVRVNDTLYSDWLLNEVLGPATQPTKDDRRFSNEFRS